MTQAKPIRLETKNPREAAFLALLKASREELFLSDILEAWNFKEKPKNLDYSLAREIAFGTERMKEALDYLALSISQKKKLNVKLKEKFLLRSAIYQFCFMDKMPPYAIVNETIEIAKKYCHEAFVRYLNGVLRRLSVEMPKLPSGKGERDLSIRFSYPLFFVGELLSQIGVEKAEEVLKAQNKSGKTMMRVRQGQSVPFFVQEGVEPAASSEMFVITDPLKIPIFSQSAEVYLQNITPVKLISDLAKRAKTPKNILDLCASPGGKLLAAHDAFPKAHLFANDVSEKKLRRLKENCEKYELKAEITCQKGEEYVSEKLFDLIILDVPCSNSGVLNKRPEARWRITEAKLLELQRLQMELLKRALELVSEEGEIWYLTCSILQRENGGFMKKALETLNLELLFDELILPDETGCDGGYAAILKPKPNFDVLGLNPS